MAEDMKQLFGNGEMPLEEAQKWPDLDEPGKFQWVPKDDLNIDKEYQRLNVNEQRVLKIAGRFQWWACGVLLVNRRGDGSLWVFDGQHRLLAARKRTSIRKMPCLIFDVDTKAEEAGGFIEANGTRGPVDAYSLFRAGLVAADETCLAVQGIVEASGYTVSNKSITRTVCCIKTLIAEYLRDKDDMRTVWRVAVSIFKGEPINGRAFSGLAYLHRHLVTTSGDSIGQEAILSQLVKRGHAQLMDAIDTRALELKRGGAKIYADGIVIMLNKYRRAKKIPDVFAPAARFDPTEDGDE